MLRRWNGNGGGRRQGPVSQVAGIVSTGKVAGPVVGGTSQTFPGFETVLRDVLCRLVVLRLRRRLVLV